MVVTHGISDHIFDDRCSHCYVHVWSAEWADV